MLRKRGTHVRYYRLLSDMRIPGRWLLGEPRDEQGQQVEPWQFREGRKLELSQGVRLPLLHSGHELDFSLTPLMVPIVTGRFVRVLEELGLQQEVQFFPVQVEARREPCFILNVLRTVRCIDEARSERVVRFTADDEEPERVGEYRIVSGLRIDPGRVGDAHIFRTWGWDVGLIVSERVKQALESQAVMGVKFEQA